MGSSDNGDHIEEVQRRISNLKPTAIIVGLGPTARLLTEIESRYLSGVRLYGCNDVFRILPVHEVVVMDPPRGPLGPKKGRFEYIQKCDPEVLWLYNQKAIKGWWPALSPDLRKRVKGFDLTLLPPHPQHKSKAWARSPSLTSNPISHTVSTPCGTTAIAWQAGHRRIGVIGVDLHDHTRYMKLRGPVSWYFSHVSFQAWQQGGRIATLAPDTKGKFWKPPWPRETEEQEEFVRRWVTAQPVDDPCPEFMKPYAEPAVFITPMRSATSNAPPSDDPFLKP